MTRFTMLVLTALCASACGGNPVRYVEVPGDGGTAVEPCLSDDQCGPDGSCDLEDGFCVRVEERVVERAIQESCNGLDDDGDGVVDNGVWGLGARSVVYEAGPCEGIVRLFVGWDGDQYHVLAVTGSGIPAELREEGNCFGSPYFYLSFRHLTLSADGHLLSADLMAEQVTSPVNSYGYDVAWTGRSFALVYRSDDPGQVARVLYIAPTDGSEPFQAYDDVRDDASGNTRGWNERIVWDGTELLLMTTDPSEGGGGAYSITRFDARGNVNQHRTLVNGAVASPYESFVVTPGDGDGHLLVWHDPDVAELSIGRLSQGGASLEDVISRIPFQIGSSVQNTWPVPIGTLVSLRDWNGTSQTVLLDDEGVPASGTITRIGDTVFAEDHTLYGLTNGFLVRQPIAGEPAVTGVARLPDGVRDIKMVIGFEDALIAFVSEGESVTIAKVGCP